MNEQFIYALEEAIDKVCTNEFVRVANMKLTGDFSPIDESTIWTFHNSLIKSMDAIVNKIISEDIQISTDVGSKLCRYTDSISTCNMSTDGFCPNSITSMNNINIGYLDDMIDHFSEAILNFINTDEPISSSISELNSNHMACDLIKKQVIRNTPDYTPCTITADVLTNDIIPFTNDFIQNKEDMITAYEKIKIRLNESIDKLCDTVRSINKRYMNDHINDKLNKVNEFMYDFVYNILSSEKNICNQIVDNIERFNQSGKTVASIYQKLSDNKNMMESVYDTTFIPSTTEDLSTRLVENDISAYREFSENVYNFHSGIFNNKYESGESDGLNSGFDYKISQFSYDREPYIDVMNIYQNILDSLNILSKNSDDYLMVFDDMIEKSGLSISLHDRFFNDLELIDRITNYSEPIANNKDYDTYYRILNDIKNYPSNMEAITQVIRDVYSLYNDLKSRFEKRINGEFNRSQSIIELQNYMEEFDDQFKYIVNMTAAKLMSRLKNLAYMAQRHSMIINDDEKPVGFIESFDFLSDAINNEIEIYRIYSESTVKNLGKSFFKLNAYKEFGINVVFEADQDNQGTQPTVDDKGSNQDNKNDGSSTKVTVNDQSSTKTVNNGTMKTIIETLKKWFDNVLNRFDTLCERQKSKNTKWLNNNKDILMNRRYVNVSASIIPYSENMDANKLLTELSNTANNITGLKTRLNTINDESDVVKTLFPNIKSTDLTKFSEDCVRYFKVGNAELSVKEYANTELGNLVKQTVIPFCEKYYDSYVESMKTNINKIKSSLSTLNESLVTESSDFIENGLLVFEADGDNGTVKNKMEWIRKYVKLYTGSALNAVRDRNNDYFKLLSALIPKNKPTYSENNGEDEEDNQNNDSNN